MSDKKPRPKSPRKKKRLAFRCPVAPTPELRRRVQMYLAGLTEEQAKALRIRFGLDEPEMEPQEEEQALLDLANQLAMLKKTKRH